MGVAVVAAQDFAQRFATDALAILGSPPGSTRDDGVSEMKSALRPSWGADDHAQTRTRLEVLTPDQRRVVSLFCDACIDHSSLRQMWRAAIEHEGSDWFDWLKLQ